MAISKAALAFGQGSTRPPRFVTQPELERIWMSGGRAAHHATFIPEDRGGQ